MARPDDLFALIRGLSTRERQHVKRVATAHAASAQYVALFDAIVKHAGEPDDALKRRLLAQWPAGRLAVQKRYLFEALCRILGPVGRDKRPGDRVALLHDQAGFVFARGLPRKALQLLERAHALARHAHRHDLLWQGLNLERRIVGGQFGDLFPRERLRAVLDGMAEAQRGMDESTRALDLYYRCMDQTWRQRTEDARALRAALEDPAFEALAGSANAHARLYRHLAWNHYHHATQAYADSERHLRAAFEVFDDAPGLLEEYPAMRIGTAHNLGNRLLLRRAWAELPAILVRLLDTPVEDDAQRAKRDIALSALGLMYGAQSGQDLAPGPWASALTVPDRAGGRLGTHHRLDLLLKRAIHHWCRGRPEAAVDDLLAARQDPALDGLRVQAALVDLLFLLAHHDLGNAALAGERAAARMRRGRWTFAFERPVYRLLRGLGEHPLPERRAALLDQSAAALVAVRDEADYRIYLPLDAWVAASREGTAFAERVSREGAALPRVPRR